MFGPLQIGAVVLGRYEVTDILAQGGEGTIAKATRADDGSLVVVKLLNTDVCANGQSVRRARAQRAASIRIGHPRVVDPIDFGDENGEWYLVAPYIEGTDLHAYMVKAAGRCPIDFVRTIIGDVVDGAEALHGHGVIHRDIKPGNILITLNGRAVLIDLGICHCMQVPTLCNGGVVGTNGWMSPEQTINPAEVDPRSDLYAIGLVLYYMLTGAVPDRATEYILRNQPITPPQHLNPDVPDDLNGICVRLLSRLPEDRFQSARELREALHGSAKQVCASCPLCSAAVSQDMAFCPSCGGHIGANPHGAAGFCIACRAPVTVDSSCRKCGRPFSPEGHCLVFDEGSLKGLTFRIPEGIYVVGRPQLSAGDLGISQAHVSIACVNGSVIVQDAGSTNKTFVDGHSADRPLQLQPNQQLFIARNRAMYLTQKGGNP
jgi:hypothetical protein